MIKQKEKILSKLFEAVELLQKYIGKSEAIKRVFVLYIILCGLHKIKRTGKPKRLPFKDKGRHNKSESVENRRLLSSIDDLFRKASPSIANAVKIRKYASGLPTEILSVLFKIILHLPKCSAKERKNIIGEFCLSINIQELLELEEEFRKHQTEIIAFLQKRLKVSEIKGEAEFQIVGHLRHSINPKLAMIQRPIIRVYKLLESRNLLGESISRNLDGTEEKAKDALDQALRQLDLINNILTQTAFLSQETYLSVLFKIILHLPKCSAKERKNIISEFCLSINIQELLEEEFRKHQREIIASLKIPLLIREFRIVSHLRHSIQPKLYVIQRPIIRVYKLLESRNLLGKSISRNLDGTKEKAKDALAQVSRQLILINNILRKTEFFTKNNFKAIGHSFNLW